MSIGFGNVFSELCILKPGDSMINSLWQNNVVMPQFPKLDHDLKTDVLIIGGGMAGILCAHKLAIQGVDHALIEADRICCGVTRNTTAKLTSQHGLIYDELIHMHGKEAARRYWEANERAIKEYRRLAKSVDCDFQSMDSYIYSRDDLQKLQKEKSALDSLGIPADFVQATQLPFPVAGAIRFADQAQFHPLKFASAIAKDLRIFEHTPAREFAGNVVTTDYGKISARKIIVTTHFPLLNKHGAYFLKLYQQRSYVLALENAGNVEGMYWGDGPSLRNVGDILLLGGSTHRTGKPGQGWQPLETFAQKDWPNARQVTRWATQDCISLDGIPYIGQYSLTTPDLYVATGFNKWGMTSSMVAAMILTDMVQEKESPYAEVFTPARTMLHSQLFANISEATGSLFRFSKPRCPHLGCALQWNAQEHSWDCPCHGSRFDEQGKRLNNPATGDLKKTKF